MRASCSRKRDSGMESIGETIVECTNVTKIYKTLVKKRGFRNSVKSLFRRDYIKTTAVKDITFSISQGEMVGLIGANGAGKTTMLKLLSGILLPTQGNILVFGQDPFTKNNSFLKRISFVTGRKGLLEPDLSAYDNYLLFRDLYGLDNKVFTEKVDRFSVMLNVRDKLDIPIRKLSLGERMKCELLCSLLHGPELLFLDEPTIGLDLNSQVQILSFLKEVNRDHKTTIIITSHYMRDIEDLCRRIMILEKGTMVYNGPIKEFTQQIIDVVSVKVENADRLPDMLHRFQPQKLDAGTYLFRLDRKHLKEVVLPLIEHNLLFTIQEPSLEDAILLIQSQGYKKHEAQ